MKAGKMCATELMLRVGKPHPTKTKTKLHRLNALKETLVLGEIIHEEEFE